MMGTKHSSWFHIVSKLFLLDVSVLWGCCYLIEDGVQQFSGVYTLEVLQRKGLQHKLKAAKCKYIGCKMIR